LEHDHEEREDHEDKRLLVGAVDFRYPQMSQMDTDVRGSERPGSPHRVQLLDLFDQHCGGRNFIFQSIRTTRG